MNRVFARQRTDDALTFSRTDAIHSFSKRTIPLLALTIIKHLSMVIVRGTAAASLSTETLLLRIISVLSLSLFLPETVPFFVRDEKNGMQEMEFTSDISLLNFCRGGNIRVQVENFGVRIRCVRLRLTLLEVGYFDF